MTTITIKEVTSEKDLMNFIQFPMELYKNNKNFVPPIISDEKKIWNPKENPALDFHIAKQFLAYRNDTIVGRIAVMYNSNETEDRKIKFGWLDFIDDISVTESLMKVCIQFAKEKNATRIEGPMGFTNLDKAGMLTYGFQELATMIGIYNYDYYPKHMEKLGFTKEKEWVEFEIVFPENLPEKIIKYNALIKKKYGLKVLKFKSKKEIIPLVEPMFQLLDETYRNLSTYTPITAQQIKTYKEKYFGLIHKDYIICIADQENKLVAFAITMPSYSKALQKANGKIFPWGWYHILKAGKKNDTANFYLIGVHPDYQKRGVTSIIFKEIWDVFKKKGVKRLETNPELEENKNIQVLWQDYNPKNHKRRMTFSKKIEDS